MKTLIDIAEINLGYSFRGNLPIDDNGNIYVIQPKNILNNDYTNLEKIFMPNLNDKYILKAGDIILTNKYRFIADMFDPKDDAIYIASSSVFVLRANNNCCVPEYLTAYINSVEGQRQISKFSETSTIPSLTKGYIENLMIPIVPFNIQSKIVSLTKDYKEYSDLLTKKMILEEKIVNNFIDKNFMLEGVSK